jgi:hypothetical protein
MMYVFKKSSLVVLAMILVLSFSFSASAATNVNVGAKVHPKAGIALNFDAFNFDGIVGTTTNPAVFSQGGTTETSPVIDIRFKDNYSVLIAGQDFTDGGTTTLDVERLSVALDGGTSAALSSTATVIDSGTATGNTTLSKAVGFNLDLSDVNNTFSDNTALETIEAATDFTTTVTFSFTSL